MTGNIVAKDDYYVLYEYMHACLRLTAKLWCDILGSNGWCTRFNRINQYNTYTNKVYLFLKNLSQKNLQVNHTWSRAILEWMTDRKIFSSAHT
jgi:hypothetical protein